MIKQIGCGCYRNNETCQAEGSGSNPGGRATYLSHFLKVLSKSLLSMHAVLIRGVGHSMRSLVSLFKVLTICACLVFLVSILMPFLTVPHFLADGHARWATYWSYKVAIKKVELGQVTQDKTLLFNNYWFTIESHLVNLRAPWVFITMFFVQLLTMIAGLSSLYLRGWKIQIIPPITSMSVTLLMIYMYMQAEKWTLGLLKYELGYWLTYLSTILFLLKFILYQQSKSTFANKIVH